MSDGLILLMALIFIVIVFSIVYISKKRIGAEEVKGTNQIKDLRLELEKIKGELSQITDPEKGSLSDLENHALNVAMNMKSKKRIRL